MVLLCVYNFLLCWQFCFRKKKASIFRLFCLTLPNVISSCLLSGFSLLLYCSIALIIVMFIISVLNFFFFFSMKFRFYLNNRFSSVFIWNIVFYLKWYLKCGAIIFYFYFTSLMLYIFFFFVVFHKQKKNIKYLR